MTSQNIEGFGGISTTVLQCIAPGCQSNLEKCLEAFSNLILALGPK